MGQTGRSCGEHRTLHDTAGFVLCVILAISNKKLQKIMTLPINQIFRYLQNRSRVQVWLHEQADLRIEGRILGFDEYMNLVVDDAEEIMVKKKTRRAIGRILLKGDNICLMMNTGV